MKEVNNKKKKIIICVVAAVLLVTALILFLYNRSRITATTMRVLRLEGTVTLTDNGKNKTIRENVRLNDGNAIATALKSLVSIGLDDFKMVTLDELSRAVFNKKGRKLDLELTDGSLFFEVTQPLTEEETFDIRTSTMIVGIRGTSGYVSVNGEHEELIVTDGHVHVIGTNPTTGEQKEIEVHNGQRIQTWLYDDREVDSIMFYCDDVTERELPEFVLDRLRENPELLDEVCLETEWDKPWILGEATEEEAEAEDVVDAIEDPDVLPTEVVKDENTVEEPTEVKTEEPTKEVVNVTDISDAELALAKNVMAGINAETGLIQLPDGTMFDPAWYAEANPDVIAKYGNSMEALIAHYIKFGKQEGRSALRPETPTPETPKQSQEPEDDKDDDDSSSGSANPVTIEYNKVVNGSFTLSDGSTGTWDDTNNKMDFSTTGSNGKITIPGTMEINGTSTNVTRSMIGNLGNATSLDASAVSNYSWSDALTDIKNSNTLTELSTNQATLKKNGNNLDVIASGTNNSGSLILSNCIEDTNTSFKQGFSSLTFPAGSSNKSMTITRNYGFGGTSFNADFGGTNYSIYIDKNSGNVNDYNGGSTRPLAKINDDGKVDLRP